MSKVDILGPKEFLEDVLSELADAGIFQIRPARIFPNATERPAGIRELIPDSKKVTERIFLEELLVKIQELLSLFSATPVRMSYLETGASIDIISSTVDRHIDELRTLNARREELRGKLSEIDRGYEFFLQLEPLLKKMESAGDLEMTGISIKDPQMLGKLRSALAAITDSRFELETRTLENGAMVGLIATEHEMAEKVKRALSEQHVPELGFRFTDGNRSFDEQMTSLRQTADEVKAELLQLAEQQESVARRWRPLYLSTRDWITGRLSLLDAALAAYETKMCFYIAGWMPADEVTRISVRLETKFHGNVTVEEREIQEEELDQAPVMLRNPPIFKPFEIFTRMLPLPSYSSYDPTPFIAIFFPLFFGMILGDAGYGLFLGCVAMYLKRRLRPGLWSDAASILAVASAYSIVFGILYGEFFGDLPHRFFGLEPLCVERRTAVVPMIFFALAVGTAHVLIGIGLGVASALRKRARKEAFFRVANIAVIVCIVAIIFSVAGLLPGGTATRQALTATLAVTVLLFIFGGILAPLELLKSIGNIISYVRIMAIGLTSALLAFVANNLAGLPGDIVIGIVLAALIHLVNIVLGVFSPTIHSLRLHYVEFFTKFLEHGGRRFEPLKRKP